jgi:hypothetical protein
MNQYIYSGIGAEIKNIKKQKMPTTPSTQVLHTKFWQREQSNASLKTCGAEVGNHRLANFGNPFGTKISMKMLSHKIIEGEQADERRYYE